MVCVGAGSLTGEQLLKRNTSVVDPTLKDVDLFGQSSSEAVLFTNNSSMVTSGRPHGQYRRQDLTQTLHERKCFIPGISLRSSGIRHNWCHLNTGLAKVRSHSGEGE